MLDSITYIPAIITPELAAAIRAELNTSNDWTFTGSVQNSREVIQYGFKYNYVNGSVDEPAGQFPPWVNNIVRIIEENTDIYALSKERFPINQCLINKYEVGQGISAHTDTNKYGEHIYCLTIGSGANMVFTRAGYQPVTLYTEPNSLYIMSGESRYLWKHEMRPVKNDVVNGVVIPRGVRISITFRTVL